MRGFIDDSSVKDIADAIREKTGEETSYKPSKMGNAIRKIGGEDLFKYATNMDYLFNLSVFPQDYELTLNVPNFTENMNRVCRFAKGVKKVIFKGNLNNKTAGMQYAFNASDIEIVDFSEWGNGEIKGDYINYAFQDTSYLHTIIGSFDCSTFVNVTGTFTNARALKEIRFKNGTLSKALSFVHSSLLSDDSIQSIIDGLADLTGLISQTITFHSDVILKLTDEQQLTILLKNWELT